MLTACPKSENRTPDPFQGCICDPRTGVWTQNYTDRKHVCDSRLAGISCGPPLPMPIFPKVEPSSPPKAVLPGTKGALESGADSLIRVEKGIENAKDLVGTPAGTRKLIKRSN